MTLVAKSTYNENKPISCNDAKIFATAIATSLENWVKVHTGHPSAVRYDPVSFGAAFNLYLRSSAAANQMKEDHCFIIPTASHFKNVKRELGIKSGQSYDMFIPQSFLRGDDTDAKVEHDFDGHGHDCWYTTGGGEGIGVSYTGGHAGNAPEWGQVAGDEMKISEGMVTNVMNDITYGITDNFTDLKTVMKNVMSPEDSEDTEKPATYVNQWWYRSTGGRVYNVMSFFNSGSLSGDIVLRQLFIVIMACEIAGSKVFLVVCDAGGPFSRLFVLLRQNKDLPDDIIWLSDDCIRFRNPYDPGRFVYASHCSTHNCKGSRNQLKESNSKGSKCFMDIEGNLITWDHLETLYLEEQALVNRTGTAQSDLCDKSVYPDRWSKMSVRHTKKSFSEKTKYAKMERIYRMLGINMKNNLELVYRVEDHQRARGLDNRLRLLGYHSAAAEHLRELQKKIAPKNQMIASMISTYEFISHTSEIYNERLLKMDEMVSWKNFKDLKAQATRNLKYFCDLRMAQLERKKRMLPK